jgi:hypothetical protein
MGQSLLLAAKDFLTNNLATIVAGGFGVRKRLLPVNRTGNLLLPSLTV